MNAKALPQKEWSRKSFMKVTMLVQVPPNVWNGFKGCRYHTISGGNLASHVHQVDEIKRLSP